MTGLPSDDRHPAPDAAEENAFFPSPYSLNQYTSPVPWLVVERPNTDKPFSAALTAGEAESPCRDESEI